MYTYMLEDIHYWSQSHPTINRIEARYKIRDCIKQGIKWPKGSLLSTQNMGRGLHKLFRAVGNELSESLPIMGESGSEVSYFVPEPRKF